MILPRNKQPSAPKLRTKQPAAPSPRAKQPSILRTSQQAAPANRVKIERCLSIVIPVSGRGTRLPRLIRRLRSWPAVQEIIVVANDCADQTVDTAKHLGAQVISYPERLGHDTGRAIGAIEARGKYVLFLDADIDWTINELRPFLRCLQAGADIALNRYPLPANPRYHHPTAVAKRALNLALDKPHLQAASMTTVPHAVRKSVIEDVGVRYLAVPPLFMTRAILAGYQVQAAAHCEVGVRNPQPLRRSYSYNLKDLILGDHAEAFHHLIQELGPRGYHQDGVMSREMCPPAWTSIAETSGAGNGASSAVCFTDSNGTSAAVCFADGNGTSAAVCFADGAPASPGQLRLLANAVTREGIDVALYRGHKGFPNRHKRDPLNTMTRFLNLMVHQPQLGLSSPVTAPYALSQRALEVFTRADLVVAPRMTVQAALQGLCIKSVRQPYQPNSADAKHQARPLRFLIGDHLEALSLWMEHQGSRGGFPQPRRLDLLEEAIRGPSSIASRYDHM